MCVAVWSGAGRDQQSATQSAKALVPRGLRFLGVEVTRGRVTDVFPISSWQVTGRFQFVGTLSSEHASLTVNYGCVLLDCLC